MPKVVWRPSRMAKSGLEDLPEVREWSGSTPEGTGVIGRSARRARSG